MLVPLRYGRGALRYLKFLALLLVVGCYFSFLYRKSLYAYEQNQVRAAAVAASVTVAEIKPATKLLKLARQQQQKQKRQQKPSTALPTQTSPPAPPPSTLNPVYEYSEEIHCATELALQQRRTHLQHVCERHNLHSHYPPNPWEFFISPGHNLVWCNVFKAASSTWMYYFNILAGYDIRYLQRTETQPLELARKRFRRPELGELLESLPSTLSFLFVRDPFERIVSAYRNKLEGARNPYYKALGHKIMLQLRRGRHKRPRHGPSFDEFVHYLIAQHAAKKRFDEHWAPVYSFCTPCSVNFSIIGKVETFQRDSEFIIRQAGLESLLLDKLPKHKLRKIANQAAGVKSDALVERYFTGIDRETLDQLLKIYRLDFELFDYNYTKYYDMVQPMPETTTSARATSVFLRSNDIAGGGPTMVKTDATTPTTAVSFTKTITTTTTTTSTIQKPNGI